MCCATQTTSETNSDLPQAFVVIHAAAFPGLPVHSIYSDNAAYKTLCKPLPSRLLQTVKDFGKPSRVLQATPIMPSNQSSAPDNRGLLDTQNIISFFLSLFDRIAAPEDRQKLYSSVFKFSYQRPVLSSFLALQLLFALFPLACFVGFSVCTTVFVVSTAVGVGIFWVGVAGVILFWTLVITFTVAAWTWLFFALCFISYRWIGRVTGFIESPPTKTEKTTNKSRTDQSEKITKPADQNPPKEQSWADDAAKKEFADIDTNGLNPYYEKNLATA